VPAITMRDCCWLGTHIFDEDNLLHKIRVFTATLAHFDRLIRWVMLAAFVTYTVSMRFAWHGYTK
jgi:hypothetical protein